jgi:hypothetical protein
MQKQNGTAGRMTKTMKTTYASEAMGRWHVRKTVTTSGTSYVTKNFVDDGWIMPAILDPRPVRLARRLRAETKMTLGWIAKQLRMGVAGSLANRLRKTQ